ncbi:endonuclease/exonuclease/phosphatase family protein [Filimonas lacunae]|uniref:endonuclease/exonuclease/phosphatase family protein n=1 Tax=Filimonas lacunae TaxID=477680 RepID=UPI0021D28511|nr:endonuclease/exonuclease/phosphatase family protein [Filimonas lacunae]
MYYNKSSAQTKYKIAIAAFYNCENFYDTLNDLLTNDDDFLPGSERHYNTEAYRCKLNNLARVIAAIGTEANPDGPAILGLAEVENKAVLEDIITHPLLQQRHYRIIHYNSKDARGVDVALLYNPVYFIPDSSGSLPVLIKGTAARAKDKQETTSEDVAEDNFYYHSRDILWVKGKLDGEAVHIYVNHWPSRLGGEARTASARRTAALLCKHHSDSLSKKYPQAKVLVMGDFNDDPVSPSIARYLQAHADADTIHPARLYNPWVRNYKKGDGTLAFRDAWGLFDQVIISSNWLLQQTDFYFYAAHVFKKEFMQENKGRYKGYPKRFWDGIQASGGFSDHFPVYIILLKKAASQLP